MLTNKQKEILNIITKYINENKMAPTVREIRELSGLSSTGSIQRYIDILEKEGLIIKEKGCSRSIRLQEIN